MQVQLENHDIMELYKSEGSVVCLNSWEFIDHINRVYELGGFKSLWFTLRMIMGSGTDSSATHAVLAEDGDFYPVN